ncbi:MAG TPA: hypothetical protein VFA85_07035 [Terriglobales bacterium]|nr:hypothetical protein [Terriglobales bacterium]
MFVPPHRRHSPIFLVIGIVLIVLSMVYVFSMRQQVKRPVVPEVHDPR